MTAEPRKYREPRVLSIAHVKLMTSPAPEKRPPTKLKMYATSTGHLSGYRPRTVSACVPLSAILAISSSSVFSPLDNVDRMKLTHTAKNTMIAATVYTVLQLSHTEHLWFPRLA